MVPVAVGKTAAVQSFILNHLSSSGYTALFVLAFLAAMCVPIPSEIIFGISGYACSTAFAAKYPGAHHLSLWGVIVVGALGTVCGATVAYVVGRTGGRAFVDRYGKKVLLSHEDLDRAERLFSRWGDGLVAVGQVIPLLRAFVGLFSGVAEVRFPRFLVLTAIGATAWVALLSGIGYAAAGSWNDVLRWFGAAGYVILAVVIVLLVVAFVHRWRRYHEAEARRAEQ